MVAGLALGAAAVAGLAVYGWHQQNAQTDQAIASYFSQCYFTFTSGSGAVLWVTLEHNVPSGFCGGLGENSGDTIPLQLNLPALQSDSSWPPKVCSFTRKRTDITVYSFDTDAANTYCSGVQQRFNSLPN